MGYERPSRGQGGGRQASKPAPAAAPAQAAPAAAPKRGGGQKSSGSATKGTPPGWDIVALDAEGEIVKEEVEFEDGGKKMLSKQIGAIWYNEGDDSMFLKLEDGTTAKVFRRKQKT